MNQAFLDWSLDPAKFHSLLDHIANGGSATDYCKGNSIPFATLRRWVFGDEDRRRSWLDAMEARREWVRESVTTDLSKIALVDVRDMFNEDHSIKHPLDWPEDLAKSVQSIEQVDYFEGAGQDRVQVGHLKKVKFYDKLKAKDLIGKTFSMFKETTQVELGDTLGDLILQSMKHDEKNRTLLTGGTSNEPNTQGTSSGAGDTQHATATTDSSDSSEETKSDRPTVGDSETLRDHSRGEQTDS